MEFNKLTLEDIKIFKPFINKTNFGICNYSIGGYFMWKDFYNIEYCIYNNILFTRENDNGIFYYHIPLGISLNKGIDILKKELKLEHLNFTCIPESMLEEFKEYDNNIKIIEKENFYDYIYDSNALREFKGKKYAGQRNLVHQFIRDNKEYSYDKITKDDINEIKEFLNNNYKIDEHANDVEIEEEKKVFEVLDNFDLYDFKGSILRSDNKIIGFSLSETINDMVYIHIEKANRNVKGAYQMLVQSFAIRYTNDNIRYINREEDVGDIGLRTSKLSYHPIKLNRKYTIIL